MDDGGPFEFDLDDLGCVWLRCDECGVERPTKRFVRTLPNGEFRRVLLCRSCRADDLATTSKPAEEQPDSPGCILASLICFAGIGALIGVMVWAAQNAPR